MCMCGIAADMFSVSSKMILLSLAGAAPYQMSIVRLQKQMMMSVLQAAQMMIRLVDV